MIFNVSINFSVTFVYKCIVGICLTGYLHASAAKLLHSLW